MTLELERPLDEPPITRLSQPGTCSGVVAPWADAPDSTNAHLPFGSSAILGSFVASLPAGVAEEARTRGFATPAFAGWALVEV